MNGIYELTKSPSPISAVPSPSRIHVSVDSHTYSRFPVGAAVRINSSGGVHVEGRVLPYGGINLPAQEWVPVQIKLADRSSPRDE